MKTKATLEPNAFQSLEYVRAMVIIVGLVMVVIGIIAFRGIFSKNVSDTP